MVQEFMPGRNHTSKPPYDGVFEVQDFGAHIREKKNSWESRFGGAFNIFLGFFQGRTESIPSRAIPALMTITFDNPSSWKFSESYIALILQTVVRGVNVKEFIFEKEKFITIHIVHYFPHNQD